MSGCACAAAAAAGRAGRGTPGARAGMRSASPVRAETSGGVTPASESLKCPSPGRIRVPDVSESRTCPSPGRIPVSDGSESRVYPSPGRIQAMAIGDGLRAESAAETGSARAKGAPAAQAGHCRCRATAPVSPFYKNWGFPIQFIKSTKVVPARASLEPGTSRFSTRRIKHYATRGGIHCYDLGSERFAHQCIRQASPVESGGREGGGQKACPVARMRHC